MPSEDKDWAKHYLIDPLHEPTPSELDGISGTPYRARNASNPTTAPPSYHTNTPKTSKNNTGASVTVTEQPTGGSSSTNPFRRSSPSTGKAPYASHRRVLSKGDDTPIGASSHNTSPTASSFPTLPPDPFNDSASRKSADIPREKSTPNRRRGSSLKERYPGDPSAHPLDTIARETKAAHRSPHLRKKHNPGADAVDRLDAAAPGRMTYHHGGPYDAALLARNNSWTSSPVAALADTTAEALRATPRENVQDSVRRHRPLDGTAAVPPGTRDRYGRLYDYVEGENMMTAAGGDYKRWPGLTYHPDDIKGKGEPSYTIEKALKEGKHLKDGNAAPDADGATFELVERPAASQSSQASPSDRQSFERYSDWEGSRHATATATTSASRSHAQHGEGHGHRLSGELKRRMGSIKNKAKAKGTVEA